MFLLWNIIETFRNHNFTREAKKTVLMTFLKLLREDVSDGRAGDYVSDVLDVCDDEKTDQITEKDLPAEPARR